MNANKTSINKLHKVVMTAARAAIGDYCFKKSISYILNKCKWLNINNMIINASLKTLNNIIINKTPRTIYNLFKINRRSIVDIQTFYQPKSTELKNFFIYKTLKIYNHLPKVLKELDHTKFKKQIKTYMLNYRESDTMD